ncbi:hypothetical protein BKA62DRAFT_780329 [Auriculariales sp. MPI-PUGE-AT-0066]|nr:hypothetical protein BKA62DRAFT_780329 [Auriculariales sp. MPI-PUGE-AT-0066]
MLSRVFLDLAGASSKLVQAHVKPHNSPGAPSLPNRAFSGRLTMLYGRDAVAASLSQCRVAAGWRLVQAYVKPYNGPGAPPVLSHPFAERLDVPSGRDAVAASPSQCCVAANWRVI